MRPGETGKFAGPLFFPAAFRYNTDREKTKYKREGRACCFPKSPCSARI